MKIKIIFTIILLFCANSYSADLPPEASDENSTIEKSTIEKSTIECSDNYSALVFEENSNNILFKKRAQETAYPASLTKLMTLYLTFEALENGKLKPEQKIEISARGEEISHINQITTLNLVEGDLITVKEAIRGTIVKSFNGTAIALAEAIAGNEWSFARKMNEKAYELGMINSSFANSTGLHREGHYTNAYDLARLTRAIKKDFPDYYHLFALKEFKFKDVTYKTHNHVLLEYKGAEGMKTGFTSIAGSNLIASAKKGDKRIFSILMACKSHETRDKFTKDILNTAFKKVDKIKNRKINPKI